MAMDRRQLLWSVAAVGAGSVLAACSASRTSGHVPASGKPKRGGNLKVGLTGGGPSDTLDPHKSLTYLDTSRLQSLYSPLVQLDGNAQLEFVLAEISPRASLSEWEISLRPGITFHSGKPLTADDVIFTFNRIISNSYSGKNPLGPMDFKSLKALDRRTVLVKMTRPYSSFVEQLAASWYYLYIAPAGFNPAKPDGTGPFVCQSFAPGGAACSPGTRTTGGPGSPMRTP